MLTFAYYLLKVFICSAIMYGYYIVALRNKRFHQYNRWYLLSAVGVSFLVPLMRIEFLKETVQPSGVMKVITIVSDADVYVAKNTPSFWGWDNIALVSFSFISLIFLLSTLTALIKIFLLIKRYPKKFLDNICFVFSNTPGTPFSFFRYIFWNTDIDVDSNAGKHILKHELAHVEEMHSGDKLFINLALVIGWYNPFLWIIRKELNIIHEFIADQKAINNGDTQAFAEMLIKTTYTSQSLSIANSFFHSPIKRRLLMLTKLSPRYSYLRRIMILPLLTVLTMFFAFKLKENHSVHHQSQVHTTQIANSEQSDTTPYIELGVKKEKGDNLIFTKDRNGVIETLDKEAAMKKLNWKEEDVDSFLLAGVTIKADTILLRKYHQDQQQYLEDLQKQNESTKKYLQDLQKQEEGKKKYLQDKKKYEEDKQKQLEDLAKQEVDFKLVMRAAAGNDEPAQFPGGVNALRKYLEKNLDASVCVNNQAPVGVYTVKLAFDVSNDGTISNIIAETNPGYGTGEEAIKVIAKGPKWDPAKKNGLPINSRVNQSISFSVSDDNQDNDSIAQFAGGLEEWRRYIFRNTDFKALNEHPAPNGKYVVAVSFVIGKDGSISNVSAETKSGYAVEDEAVRVISNGRKWKPTRKYGSLEATPVKQTMTYQVIDHRWGVVSINSIIVGDVKTNYVSAPL